MKHHNKILSSIALALGTAASLQAADPAVSTVIPDPLTPYKWNVAPTFNVKVADFGFDDYEVGAGLEGELFIAKNISVSVGGTTFEKEHSFVDEVYGQLNGYIPMGKTPASIFFAAGTLVGFEENENFHYRVGAGIRYDFSKNINGKVGGFLVDDFKAKTELRFQGSLGLSF